MKNMSRFQDLPQTKESISVSFRHAGLQLPVQQLFRDHPGAELRQVPPGVGAAQRMAGQPGSAGLIPRTGQNARTRTCSLGKLLLCRLARRTQTHSYTQKKPQLPRVQYAGVL